jgi:hypothetical protein
VRRAVALVRGHCRWEHAGQPFFSGEVEPCINGRTVTLGTYFDQDVDGVVARLLGEQLEDGDRRPSRWNTLRALRVLRWYESRRLELLSPP